MSSVLKQSQPLSSFKEVRESAVLRDSAERRAFWNKCTQSVLQVARSKIPQARRLRPKLIKPSAEEDILFSWYFLLQVFKIHSFVSCGPFFSACASRQLLHVEIISAMPIFIFWVCLSSRQKNMALFNSERLFCTTLDQYKYSQVFLSFSVIWGSYHFLPL